MKPSIKRYSILLVMTLGCGIPAANATEPFDYTIFDNYPLDGAYYYSSTESTSPSWIENLQAKLPLRTEPAYTAGSSLELGYVSAIGGKWKAKVLHRPIRGQDDWDNGVFIQTKPTPFKRPEILHLRLLCKAEDKGTLPSIALLTKEDKTSGSVLLEDYVLKSDSSKTDLAKEPKMDPAKSETTKPESGKSELAKSEQDGWLEVRIPITKFKDVSISAAEQIKGIVIEQSGADADARYHRIFLDDIDLRPASDPKLPAALRIEGIEAKGFERHVDVSWNQIKDESVEGVIIERSTDGTNFKPVGFRQRWMSRYADYTGCTFGKYYYRTRLLGYDGKRSEYSNACSATTRPMTDDELLDMVQEACGRYYVEGGEEFSGMTLESIPGDPHMIATGASGFGIMSLVVATSRQHISRAQGAERMQKILSFLEREDRFHGAMAHYYDGSIAHPKLFFGPDDNGGDLVETSFLMQGLLTARQFFDKDDAVEQDIRKQISSLWESVEWNFYQKSPDSNYLLWHWSPDKAFKINHHLIGWNETMITYLLAIASPTHSVPPRLYYSGYASQERSAQEYRGDSAGKMYSNGDVYFGVKLDVGGATGGPIFFTHYNFLGMDPHGLKDHYTEYFKNSQAIATINYRYCQSNPQHHFGYGSDGWGLTASDGPWSYNPDEPRPEGDKGKLTPTGAIASMPYMPTEAIAALKNYYRNYGSFAWGEYGFRDAFSLDDHWVNDLYMGLNQGPMIIMIENYRSGLPWKLFGSNPEIQRMRKEVFESTP